MYHYFHYLIHQNAVNMSSSYADLSDCELRKCIQLLTSMPLPAENATRAQLLVKLRECFGDIGTDTEDAADVPGMVAVRNVSIARAFLNAYECCYSYVLSGSICAFWLQS